MTKRLFFLLMIALSSAKLYGAPTLKVPVNFERSVDFSRDCKDIADNAACDSSNFIGDRNGSIRPRYGSKRVISQAISTQPFSALFSACISSSTEKAFNVTIGVSGDSIYISTDDVQTDWRVLYSGLRTRNQRFSFAVANNIILMTGYALTDPIFQYNVSQSSFAPLILVSASSSTAYIYAKYLLYESNQLFAANVREASSSTPSTTYKDRIYYTPILQLSSFTISRYIETSVGDGEEITGLTSKRSATEGRVIIEAYKPSSVNEISYTDASPSGEGGDIRVTNIGKGFGHIAESPPENIGDWDVVFSKDGLLLFDGGRRSRINVEAERIVFSEKISPIIEKLIRRNTYKSAILKYNPKNKYIYFIFEDPDKFPKGVLNSVYVYDLLTTEWWPYDGLTIGSIALKKECNGREGVIYGDGIDGYIREFENPINANDARKEMPLDNMDTTFGWSGAGISNTTMVEGTASLKLTVLASSEASIGKIAVFNLSEWPDKSETTSRDKLSFKIFPSSVGVLSSIRIDLLVNDSINFFDSSCSSVTLSSAALTQGTSQWSTIEIAFSSFPIRADWVDISSPSFPFANNMTRFGLRFVATTGGGGTVNLYIDDLRFVGESEAPINPSRLSKRFNFNSLADKNILQLILNRTKSRDTGYKIDTFSGFGKFENTISQSRDIGTEIFVCGYNGSTGVSKLSSIDFTEIDSTKTLDRSAFNFNVGAYDGKNLFLADQQNDRLVKILVSSSMKVFSSTFGTVGSGTTNFNFIQDIKIEKPDEGLIYLIDHTNNRQKIHKKSNLTFVKQHGQLGSGSTSYHAPTSIDFTDKEISVGNDGNQKITVSDKDSKFLREKKIDINTVGDISIAMDEENLYAAYTKGSEVSSLFYDVILEKRNKGTLEVLNRRVLRPEGVVANSTYTLRGQIALKSNFVFVPFSDDYSFSGGNYIQKFLKDDLQLVSQHRTNGRNFSVIGDGLIRESWTANDKLNLKMLPDPYIQIRIYQEGDLDSVFKLNSMTFYSEELEFNP